MRIIDGDRYYAICLKLKFQSIFIIWIGGDVDTVAVNHNSKIIAFKTKHELDSYLIDNNLKLTDDVTMYDIGYLQQWIIDTTKAIDYDLFLNAWNLFTDISSTLKIEFIGNKKNSLTNSVYDKLFDVAGPFLEDDFDTALNAKQILILKKTMENGLQLFFNNLSISVQSSLMENKI